MPLDRVEKFYLCCVGIVYDDLETVLAYCRTMSNNMGHPLRTIEALNVRVRDMLVEAPNAGQVRDEVDVDVLEYS